MRLRPRLPKLHTKTALTAAFTALLAFGSITVASIGTSSISVPESIVTDTTAPLVANELRPAACASLDLTEVRSADSGPIGPANTLVLGGSASGLLVGGDGDDCLVGSDATEYFDGGLGHNICIAPNPAAVLVNCELGL